MKTYKMLPLVTAMIIAVGLPSQTMGQSKEKIPEATLVVALAHAVRQARETLPETTGKNVTMIHVSSVGVTLEFVNKLNLSKENLEADFVERAKNHFVITLSCEHEDARHVLYSGGKYNYQYVYEDNNSIPVADFTIDKEDYAG